MRSIATLLLGVTCLAAPAAAQHVHEASPYANQAATGIASLSADEVEALRTGAGMGLARAAELNSYPGPLHVLELADSLGLTAEQKTEVTRIRQAMLERAIELGEEIIDQERALSMRFEHGHVDDATIQQATAAIGALQGELRYTHLVSHLAVKALLTAEQVESYDRLRGYNTVEGSVDPDPSH